MEVAMFSLIVVFFCSFFLDARGEGALSLTEANFDHSIELSPHFIMFFAPWCGHCKRLLPTWDELATKYSDAPESITIAKVDCTTDTSLCAKHNVQGYPTLKFLNGDINKRFTGKRSLEELSNFVEENIHGKKVDVEMDNGLATLTGDTFDDYTSTGMHFVEFYAPWCGHCKQLEPTWKKLAENYKDSESMYISKMDCIAHSSKCGQHDIKAFPTLKMFKNGFEIGVYNGDRSYDNLVMYVQEMISRHKVMKTRASKDPGVKATPTQEEIHNSVDIPLPVETEKVEPVTLSTEEFDTFISKGTTFVKFFAPWCGHCQRLAPTWDDLAKKCSLVTNGPIIAKVDCTIESGLCEQHRIQGYPTLRLFQNGKMKDEYSGDRDLDSLYDFIMEHHKKLAQNADHVDHHDEL